jgi:protein-S-isoprenylcysteine O-methyltransferase Ste14
VGHWTNPRRSLRLQRAGIAFVCLGTLATLITLLSLFTGSEPLPLAFYLVCLLAPLGVGLILWGLLEMARARSVIARQLADENAGGPAHQQASQPTTQGDAQQPTA